MQDVPKVKDKHVSGQGVWRHPWIVGVNKKCKGCGEGGVVI